MTEHPCLQVCARRVGNKAAAPSSPLLECYSHTVEDIGDMFLLSSSHDFRCEKQGVRDSGPTSGPTFPSLRRYVYQYCDSVDDGRHVCLRLRGLRRGYLDHHAGAKRSPCSQ